MADKVTVQVMMLDGSIVTKEIEGIDNGAQDLRYPNGNPVFLLPKTTLTYKDFEVI